MVYTYTIPRGPIAAMYSSPGPCYPLPGLVGYSFHDPRSVHNKGPQWSFGIKHGKFRDECSPGPCYLPSTKIYRNGRDGTPHYSLYSRPRDNTLFAVPGPGAYAPEKTVNFAYTRAPAYVFGLRHRQRSFDDNPGPNKYCLDPMLCKTIRSTKPAAPCFSLTGKSKIGGFHEDLQKTPGPGTYTVIGPDVIKDKNPQYSMTSRHEMPGDTTRKPGPGAYSPEQVKN
ncbi:unnamed protein product [Protopolystoma xenopodis]|uniref:Outer dense fiber protein 3 n=1 Tax=Protopolystoma xenopodis TaxID=117903 RepID=A0A3S5AUD6_9PLAT|nr:unnamed protein product [Protopolystoma xenopodis]